MAREDASKAEQSVEKQYKKMAEVARQVHQNKVMADLSMLNPDLMDDKERQQAKQRQQAGWLFDDFAEVRLMVLQANYSADPPPLQALREKGDKDFAIEMAQSRIRNALDQQTFFLANLATSDKIYKALSGTHMPLFMTLSNIANAAINQDLHQALDLAKSCALKDKNSPAPSPKNHRGSRKKTKRKAKTHNPNPSL